MKNNILNFLALLIVFALSFIIGFGIVSYFDKDIPPEYLMADLEKLDGEKQQLQENVLISELSKCWGEFNKCRNQDN